MLLAPTPFSLVLFGASGHLAKLKLYPALYVLALKKRLPEHYAIVGFARTPMEQDAFRSLVETSIREAFPEVTEQALRTFLEHVHYHAGQYDKTEDFTALRWKLEELEHGTSSWVRLAYLSIPPTVYDNVIVNLCRGGIHNPEQRSNFRCIVEKPVGHDFASAAKLHAALTQCFREDEVYLLDHYLGKEAVRNIYYLRFANPIFERIFKNTLINHVEIIALENKGIEGRSGYFEHTGTFRDMVQSHLLEMAALLTMRLLEGSGSVREQRQHAMEQFYLPPASNLDEIILQGQYETYQNEKGVAKSSRTNTFIAMKLLSRTSRWQGVPFYLKTGKSLDRKETRISLQFQEPHVVGKGSFPNRLDMILQGEAGMKIHLQTKLGGTEPAFRPLILTDPLVCYGDCLPEHGLLLLEAIHGKQEWFLRFAEVQAAWRIVDPLQKYLDNTHAPLYQYAVGGKGPAEAASWMQRDGRTWME